MKFVGNCVNSFDEFGDCIIPQLPFANVTEFAQLVEESDDVEIDPLETMEFFEKEVERINKLFNYPAEQLKEND